MWHYPCRGDQTQQSYHCSVFHRFVDMIVKFHNLTQNPTLPRFNMLSPYSITLFPYHNANVNGNEEYGNVLNNPFTQWVHTLGSTTLGGQRSGMMWLLWFMKEGGWARGRHSMVGQVGDLEFGEGNGGRRRCWMLRGGSRRTAYEWWLWRIIWSCMLTT